VKKEENPNTMLPHLHFLSVWTKLDTFYFQIFHAKKRESINKRRTLSVINTDKVLLLFMDSLFFA
jgi:hypothetical protein